MDDDMYLEIMTIAWRYLLEREIMTIAGPCDCLPVREGAMDLNPFDGCYLSLGELKTFFKSLPSLPG